MNTSDQFLDVLADKIAGLVAGKVLAQMNKSQGHQKALLTIAEAAHYIGRSKPALENLIYNRQIPVVRRGRRVHLHKQDLDDWINKHRC